MSGPDVQLFLRPGIVEFAWGHPDLALLPVAGLAKAARLALREAGPAALAYGAEQGPGRLIEQLRARLAGQEAVAPSAGEILITGGVSQALDMLCTLLTRPGDPLLVQSPVYHLALRIFRDHGLQLVPVAADEHGLRPEALEEALAGLARQGRTAPLLYTVPAFANPTGTSLSEERGVGHPGPGGAGRLCHPRGRRLPGTMVRRTPSAGRLQPGAGRQGHPAGLVLEDPGAWPAPGLVARRA